MCVPREQAKESMPVGGGIACFLGWEEKRDKHVVMCGGLSCLEQKEGYEEEEEEEEALMVVVEQEGAKWNGTKSNTTKR